MILHVPSPGMSVQPLLVFQRTRSQRAQLRVDGVEKRNLTHFVGSPVLFRASTSRAHKSVK